MKPEPSQPLAEREAAKALGLSIRTLQKWRVNGNGPKFVRMSARAIRYRPEDLEAFIAARVRTSTSEPDSDQG